MSRALKYSKRLFLGLVVAALVVLFAPSAQAQLIGLRGTLAVGVENVTGYDVTTVGYRNITNVDITDTTTQFSFLLKNGARVGVHYFILPQVSLGGSLGYESFSGSVTQPDVGGTYSQDKPTNSMFLLNLKAGYLLPLANRAGFWFRAGPGVYRSSQHPYNPAEFTETFWTVGLDVLFVYAPYRAVGLFAGPGADLAFVGRHSEYNVGPANNLSFSHSASYRRLGLDFGMMVMF
jgi:hypothetical protein